ncbi:MAG: glycosyltransferase [Egibacteraceae bacterium]
MTVPETPEHVLQWAQQRAEHRANRDFAAADALRDRIAGAGYQVSDTPDGPVVTRASRFVAVAAHQVPDHRDTDDAHDASVLLLLDAFGLDGEPEWLVADATRCLASVLAHSQGRDYEVVILDNGIGGAAGDWAADAARNPGVTALHLSEAVGFAEARALQHRVATGRILLWLDTSVELRGDVLGRLAEVFDDPGVGAAGRWGAVVGHSVQHFDGVEPPAVGVRDVHAVWSYLLGLRRTPLRTGAVELDLGFRFYRNADADVSFRVRAAGARTVVCDLPATQHVHRGYSETPRAVVERESRRNYRRLLDRWRADMQALVGG